MLTYPLMTDFNLDELVPSSPSGSPASRLKNQKPHDMDIFDKEDKNSLLNMLTDKVVADIEGVFAKYPRDAELFFSGEEQLIQDQVAPTMISHRLRYSLWNQYHRALDLGEPRIELVGIYAGICTRQTFYHIIKTKQIFWMLTRPSEAKVMMEVALNRGIHKLHQLLEVPCIDKNGKVNTALASMQMRIIAMFDVRLNGNPTQKIENTNKNLSVETKVSEEDFKKMFLEYQNAEKIIQEPRLGDVVVVQEAHSKMGDK